MPSGHPDLGRARARRARVRTRGRCRHSSPAARASSGRPSSTGCWPRTGGSTSSTTSRPARSPTWRRARALPDRRFSFHRLDVASPAVVDLITHRKPDVIFHLAAQMDVRVSVARPVFDATVNVIGSLNVFEGAVAAGVKKIVFAGSGGTLYGTPEKIPTKETVAAASRSRRTASRRRPSATTSTTTGSQRGLEYTVLALANVYGPRQNPHGEAGVVAIFSNKLLDARAADDLRRRLADPRLRLRRRRRRRVRARASEKGGGLTMNIGTGIETSVQQLYDVMAKLTGFREPARVRARPHRRAAAQRGRPGPGRDPPRLEAVHVARRGPGAARSSTSRASAPRPAELGVAGVTRSGGSRRAARAAGSRPT